MYKKLTLAHYIHISFIGQINFKVVSFLFPSPYKTQVLIFNCLLDYYQCNVLYTCMCSIRINIGIIIVLIFLMTVHTESGRRIDLMQLSGTVPVKSIGIIIIL